ncbi:unnamed protein product [Brugia pahangi]|uniref:Uncharacterized protein n=1 Tax=Brugia pahangi TaxID=6280 RepID=A0A0N4T1Z6_BRUPA|nr:unnamed protein product [Brugia pahangi]
MKRHSGDDDLSSSDIHERLLVSSRGVGGIIGKESSVKVSYRDTALNDSEVVLVGRSTSIIYSDTFTVAGDHFHWLVRTVDEIIENKYGSINYLFIHFQFLKIYLTRLAKH